MVSDSFAMQKQKLVEVATLGSTKVADRLMSGKIECRQSLQPSWLKKEALVSVTLHLIKHFTDWPTTVSLLDFNQQRWPG